MSKKTYTFALLLAIALCTIQQAIAQTGFSGKPVYQIEAKRAGNSIGTITVELFPLIAPLHTRNFDSLVAVQFYDSTAFHRVVPGFVIQGGDPNSKHGPRNTWGYGQPGQPTVNAEFSAVSHIRGILSAARDADINSANSQFFICVAPALHLDGQYSAYGRVVSGMQVVDDIVSSPRDATDNPYQKIEMFIRRTGSNESIPLAPQNLSPTNGYAGAQQNQTLSWSSVTDAALYTLQVSTDSAFSSFITNQDIKQTATSFALNNLTPNTVYYWRIRTNNGGHLSPWSASNKFTTGMQAVVLQSPANSTSVSAPLTLQWELQSSANSYRVQVARTPLFQAANMVLDSSGVAGNTLYLSNLTNNTRYYWRVQGQQNGTDGFYSPTWNFRVSSVTGINDLLTTGFTVSPNPLISGGLIQLRTALKTEATLTITNALGRLIEKTTLPLGTTTYYLPTVGLVAGHYTISITTTDSHYISRILVVK